MLTDTHPSSGARHYLLNGGSKVGLSAAALYGSHPCYFASFILAYAHRDLFLLLRFPLHPFDYVDTRDRPYIFRLYMQLNQEQRTSGTQEAKKKANRCQIFLPHKMCGTKESHPFLLRFLLPTRHLFNVLIREALAKNIPGDSSHPNYSC